MYHAASLYLYHAASLYLWIDHTFSDAITKSKRNSVDRLSVPISEAITALKSREVVIAASLLYLYNIVM